MSDPLRLGDPRSEEKLGFLLVKEKVITESQLKTALDFQRAVGGHVDEVIVRLQFVDRAIMKRVLSKLGISRSQESDDIPRHAAPPSPAPSPEVMPRREEPEPEDDPDPLEEAFGEILDSGGDEGDPTVDRSHTAIILDALLRILIRKGLVGREEIKQELKKLESEQV